MKKIFFVVCLCFLFASNCPARIFFTITKNLSEKAEIVILLDKVEGPYWRNFLSTIKKDLEYSGYFTIPTAKFVKDINKEKKGFSTELILYNENTAEKVKFAVYDPLDNENLFEKDFSIPANPRAFAHRINDEIVLALTGKHGIASSRISFVSDKNNSYQIYTIDYDGENLRQVTEEEYLVHYPRWLPENKSLLFVSYKYGWPKIAKFDIADERITTLLNEPGLNACASVCPETKEIAVVLSKTGSPEIYIVNFNGEILKRLTYYGGINSSPSFSPDGKMLAFVSDKQGTPQIYIMNRDGFQIRRISYVSSYSTSPAWSPDGNFIAYVFAKESKFSIALYEIATGKTVVISTPGSEEISWAPDSKHIVYSRTNTKPSSLWIIDIFTKEKRKLTPEKYNCFSPSWSFY